MAVNLQRSITRIKDADDFSGISDGFILQKAADAVIGVDPTTLGSFPKFADDTARNQNTPRSTGILGVQLNTGNIYISTGTSAGNWQLIALSIDQITGLAAALSNLSPKVGGTDIVTVGVVTGGTWNAGIVDVAHGGTGQASFLSGSLLKGAGTAGLDVATDGTDYMSPLQIVTQSAIFGADTGVANAYVIATNHSFSFSSGSRHKISTKAAHSNTGASTINLNGRGAVAIKKYGTVDLISGDILAGGLYEFVYDGASYQLLNPSTEANPAGIVGRTLVDSLPRVSIDWGNRSLLDLGENKTVDWGNFGLFAGGVKTIDWAAGWLMAGDVMAVVWTSYLLMDAASGTSLNWNLRQLVDSGGVVTVDWSLMNLSNPLGSVTVDWNACVLFNNSHQTVLDWSNLILYDGDGNQSLSWEGRTLVDSSSLISIDWGSRLLYDATGTTNINFNAPRQPGGELVASTTLYGTNEADMLQKAFDCLRTFGLLD
jgi:hypothetical protein